VDKNIKDSRKLRENIRYYIYDDNKWIMLNGCQKRSLKTIFINDDNKTELMTNIKNFLLEKDLYTKLGIPYKYNVLFYGIPGTGKTSFVTAIASELNYDIAFIPSKSSDLKDDKQLIIALSKLPKNCILLIEDVELMSKNINLTSILDGATIRSGLMTFMTSNIKDRNDILSVNHTSSINNPLTRPCRVDYDLYFTWAKKKEIIEMCNKFYLKTEMNSSENFYDNIKGIKLTISLLQEFFFKFRSKDEIFENIHKLKELSNKYYSSEHSYYS